MGICTSMCACVHACVCVSHTQEMHRTDCIFIDPYDGVGYTSENLQDEDTLSPQTTTNSRAPATATTGQQASSAGSTTKAQAANGNNTNAAANGGAAESGSEEGEGDGDEEEGETEEGEEEGEDLLLVDEVDVSDGRKKRVQEEDGAEGDDSEVSVTMFTPCLQVVRLTCLHATCL